MNDDGWKEEALQLRANHKEHSAMMTDFVELFEECEVGTGNRHLLCLALHHLAMNFHVVAGKKTMKSMMKSCVDDLPDSYGDFGGKDVEQAKAL